MAALPERPGRPGRSGRRKGTGTGRGSGGRRLTKGEKSPARLARIAAEVAILRRIRPATVRAVAYQLFVRKRLVDVKKTRTNLVSDDLVWARELGLGLPDPDTGKLSPYADQAETYAVPPGWIVEEAGGDDYTPVLDKDVDEFLGRLIGDPGWYRLDPWSDQPVRVVVISEKSTVQGTVRPVLERWLVPFKITHGHASMTKATAVADQSAAFIERFPDRRFVALYVGDFDPSGMHMSEVDLPRRLARYGGRVEVRRIALSADDKNALDAAGLTFSVLEKWPRFGAGGRLLGGDPRAPWFKDTYGSRCAELDALDPPRLRQRVEAAITGLIDPDAWRATLDRQAGEREVLARIVADLRGRLDDLRRREGV